MRHLLEKFEELTEAKRLTTSVVRAALRKKGLDMPMGAFEYDKETKQVHVYFMSKKDARDGVNLLRKAGIVADISIESPGPSSHPYGRWLVYAQSFV